MRLLIDYLIQSRQFLKHINPGNAEQTQQATSMYAFISDSN